MTRIVRTSYRYKRPPKRRKAVALEVPGDRSGEVRDRKRVKGCNRDADDRKRHLRRSTHAFKAARCEMRKSRVA
jgi:hypothetical protein